MNPTLKTFEDGSEITLSTAAATAAASLLLAGIGAYATVKFDEWRTARWLKKHGYWKGSEKK